MYGGRLLKLVLVLDKVRLLGLDDVIIGEMSPPLVEKATLMNTILGCKFIKANRSNFFNASEIDHVDTTIYPIRVYFTENENSNFMDIPDKMFKRHLKEGAISALFCY